MKLSFNPKSSGYLACFSRSTFMNATNPLTDAIPAPRLRDPEVGRSETVMWTTSVIRTETLPEWNLAAWKKRRTRTTSQKALKWSIHRVISTRKRSLDHVPLSLSLGIRRAKDSPLHVNPQKKIRLFPTKDRSLATHSTITKRRKQVCIEPANRARLMYVHE